MATAHSSGVHDSVLGRDELPTLRNIFPPGGVQDKTTAVELLLRWIPMTSRPSRGAAYTHSGINLSHITCIYIIIILYLLHHTSTYISLTSVRYCSTFYHITILITSSHTCMDVQHAHRNPLTELDYPCGCEVEAAEISGNGERNEGTNATLKIKT